jgi:hypothetical protein
MHHILFQTCFYMYYFFIRSQLLLSSKKPAENRPELAKYVLSQFCCRYVDVPTSGKSKWHFSETVLSFNIEMSLR